MILLTTAVFFILVEAISEGFLSRTYSELMDFIFKGYVQFLIALFLFITWLFTIAIPVNEYVIPTWKVILGFIGVRFLIFDFAYNISAKQKLGYYGKKKWYDKIMFKLSSWGLMMKIICGIIGIVFLVGKN